MKFTDSIDRLRSLIQDEEGIPPDLQHILYAGKQLKDGRTLSDYYISEGATIQVISTIVTHPISPTQPVYYESVVSMTKEDVQKKVNQWRLLARDGSFDADIDIVDPMLYHRHLEFLAEGVAEFSEFKRCRGSYNLFDERTWDAESLPKSNFEGIPDWMWAEFGSVNLEVLTTRYTTPGRVTASLWKTSLILSRVLAEFQRLEKEEFCQTSFNLIVLNYPRFNTAEIVKIPINDVKIIHDGALKCMENIHYNKESLKEAYLQSILSEHVFAPCQSLLTRFHWPIKPNGWAIDIALSTGRMTALLVELALLSYAGSHGCRFDMEYFGKHTRSFGINWSPYEVGFRCSLRRLACLEAFLDKREVWVFEFPTPDNTRREYDGERLSILTKMEDFADIWGPVYGIPTTSGSGKIRQYNVSKGIICGTGRKQPELRNAVKCHWNNRVSWLRGLAMKFFPPSENSCFSPDDLLLIGAVMTEKENCGYTLEQYEKDYGQDFQELGTRASTWRWDTRGLSFGFSKTFGVTGTGTQKRIPETTLKDKILDKWNHSPDRRNPHNLNQYLGVEVSHCSGNARRIALRTLLTLPPMVETLERQFPNWRKTPWGAAFWDAISGQDDSAVVSVDPVRGRQITNWPTRRISP